MREADMQVMFCQYLRLKQSKQSAVFELKICKGTSLPFDSVKEHQIKALTAVKNGFYHKLTDPPVFAGMNTKFNSPRPFDCFYLIGIEAFIVIWFYHERKPKEFIFIPIEVFLKEKENSTRKSLTEVKAKEIGTTIKIK